MNFLKKNKTKIALLIAVVFCSSQVNAIGLSAFRIYLDKQQTQQNFVVYNKDPYAQICTIKPRHFLFDEVGQVVEHKGETLPDVAADPWLRYSPRKFTVGPGKIQNVRFQMRRKSNMQPKEYRSFISLKCQFDEETMKNQQLVSNVQLQPILRHNIPVIVRTGALDAELFFDDMSLNKNTLSFSFNKVGKRSTYGDLLLVNKNTNKVLHRAKKVSLQLETAKKDFMLPLMGFDIDDLAVKFVEDRKLSGDQVIQFPLSNIGVLGML